MNELKRIIQELQAKGLKQAAIARACGVHRSTVHRIASGEQHDLRFSAGVRVVRLLDGLESDKKSPR